MHRELLEHYNRELALLYEYAQDFAEEYPGIAERLGGLTRERSDPMIIGLLEGTALLAARVQLKLKHEFPEFTNNLIEQLLPNYLAPIPSAMLAQIQPTFGDPALRDGRTIAKGTALDAVYREKERNVSCRFTLCSDITYFPFEIERADYLPVLGALQAIKLNVGSEVAAGLRISLRLRTQPRREDEPSGEGIPEDPMGRFAGVALSSLPIHLVGAEAEAISIYEQIFAQLNGVYIRHLDSFGDPQFIRLGLDSIEQVGFTEEEALLPYDTRVFRGFERVQEYFVFPRKFLGFRIKNLAAAIAQINVASLDIILTFNQSYPRLAAAVEPKMFALFAGAAVNLFEKSSDRIPIVANQHEYHVVPDRTQYVNFEPHRVLDVFMHYPGRTEKRRVNPLYRASVDSVAAQSEVNYSTRRLARKRSSDERKFGSGGDYVGTDMFVSISQIPAEFEGQGQLELSVRAICSNRHLAEHLPTGHGGADFRFRDDAALDVMAVIPPTRPREAPVALKHDSMVHLGMGPVAWRLINMLSLNHRGLTERDGRAIREILSMFADLGDITIDRRIRGIRSIESKPVVRRIQQRGGAGAARGIEITVTFEDKAFEGSGIFLLGAVLDRFFAEYAAINHFTQTVIRSVERGVITRWPPRSGSRTVI